MAVWLRIKYFLIETILEILTLSGLKTGIQAVPLSQAVFLSFSAVSMSGALVVLEFILVMQFILKVGMGQGNRLY